MTRLENGPVISTDPDDWFQLKKEHCQTSPRVFSLWILLQSSFAKKANQLKSPKVKKKTLSQGVAKKRKQIILHPWLSIGSLKELYREVRPQQQTLHLSWKRDKKIYKHLDKQIYEHISKHIHKNGNPRNTNEFCMLFLCLTYCAHDEIENS